MCTALRHVQVAPVWFLAQYTFTLSLANTSVTSNTILSSSSSMFTLLASALVLRERVTAAKLASVAAVMAGAPHAAQQLQARGKHCCSSSKDLLAVVAPLKRHTQTAVADGARCWL
jgi:alpha-D-ribose 1-methylphosphonate 5-triphosphate diphosphatase PhnM